MLRKILFIGAFSVLCIKTEIFFPILPQRYCERNCRYALNKYRQNLGCDCENTRPIKGLKVIESDQKFRAAILDKLNQFRNKIAEGSINGFPSATNMLALNYDVGLEYSAHCASKVNAVRQPEIPCVRNKYEGGVDSFATMEKSSKIVDLTSLDVTLQYLDKHLNLINDLTLEKLLNWDLKEARHINVAKLVYSLFYKVGCSRYMHPKSPTATSRYIIFCVLGTLYGPESYFAPHKEYFYDSGTKCSSCPLKHYYEVEEMPCNSKYTALCGNVDPVPTYKWKNGSLPDEPWLYKLWYTATGNMTK